MKHFDTVEINNTFYHLPKKTSVERWHKQAPKDFVYAVKASRYITHIKKLNDTEEGLTEALDDESLVLSSISEEVVYHDRNMAIIWANRAAAESAGLTLEQLVGRMCYEVWHGREQPCDGCPIQKVMNTGTPAEAETTTPNGRAYHVHGYPVCEDGGQIVGTVEIVHEITQRRQAERVLRESEEKYRLLFEQSPIGIGLASPDGRPLAANKAMEAITGYPLEDFNKMDLASTYQNPQDREALLQAVQRDGRVTNYEVGLKRKDGTSYTALLTVSRVRIGGQDLLQTICIDVSDRRQAEEALRESEARYRAVVEDQTELICRFTPGRRVTFVNDAICRYYGLPRDQILGMDFRPNIHPDDSERVGERLASLSPEQPVEMHENRAILSSGEVRWLQWTNRGIFDEAGRLIEVQAVGRDVTERKRAEETLRQSEANYRAIFNAANDFIVIHDLETGAIVDANQRLCETFGYTLDELRGKSAAFLSSDSGPYTKDNAARMRARLLAGEQPVVFEWLGKTRDGRELWVEVALRRAAIGGKDRALAVVRDISDRKAAEEALRRSEENYRVLFEESLDGIVVVADGRVAGANRAFADIHRMDLNDVLGMPITEFMHPDEREEALANIQSVLEGRGESHTDRGRRVKRADGTFALIEVLLKRIDWEGGPAVQAIVRNITEMVRLEEELRQAQKMEAVGQLAGGIAHDFSNLMTGILCHAALLKVEDPSPDDVREAADLIEGAARRATELTSQLLGFARRGARHDVTVDLNATIETSVRLLSRSLDSHIRVATRFCDEQALVRGDPVQMEQVVLNLAMNARDAMPDGGEMTFILKALDVRPEDCCRRPGAKPGRYVVLSVEDTGCGMSEATRGRIFDPFYTTKPPGKGTGMGLAMVYGIVKDHGGWVELDSEPGRGTSFRVFLPAAEPAADAEAPRP